MSVDLGDRTEDSIIHFIWSTNAADGSSITRAVNGTVAVYKNDDLTQSVAGITDTEDFDATTGIHLCKIDTSADAFYAASEDYTVVLSGATIDGKSVNAVLAVFSIENRFMRGTDSAALAATALSDVMWTDAKAGALTDWLNGERLDAILDLCATSGAMTIAQNDLNTLTGADGATLATAQANYAPNTTVPDAAGTLASYDPPTRTEATADKDAIIADLLTMKKKVAGTYDRETDSMEAIRDRGDDAWTTGAGGSSPTVGEIRAEMEGVGTKLTLALEDTDELQTDWINGGRLDLLLDQIIGDNYDIIMMIDDLNDLSSANVTTACNSSLTSYDPPTRTEATADKDAIIANIATLNDITVADIIAGISDGTLDLQEMMRIILAATAGKSSGGGTVTLTFRDAADSKARITATVDANGNRTAMTLDGA